MTSQAIPDPRPAARTVSSRIEAVDLARGLALIAMTTFHFGWDMEFFGYAPPGFASQPAMVWYARCIASSFLFLVGVSMVLAHGGTFRAGAFLKRLAMIGGAALAISVATWFATPDAFIFFGILHHIAVASVLGLLFLRMPWWLNYAAAALFILARMYLRTPLLDDPWWWWSGLSSINPRSNDYVPVFPFMAAVLAGMATTQLAARLGWLERLASVRLHGPVSRLLRFIGRHSLIYYLVHQPVMIGLIIAFQWVTGI